MMRTDVLVSDHPASEGVRGSVSEAGDHIPEGRPAGGTEGENPTNRK